MKKHQMTLAGLAVLATFAGCATAPESRVHNLCRFIRPDMTLTDASDLFGLQARFDSGNWYWTDSRKFIVHTGERHRIVEVYDFYRAKRYHKLLNQTGVFEEDMPRTDDEGNPIE